MQDLPREGRAARRFDGSAVSSAGPIPCGAVKRVMPAPSGLQHSLPADAIGGHAAGVRDTAAAAPVPVGGQAI